MFKLPIVLVAVAAAPSLLAQGVVSPAHFTDAEAPTYWDVGIGTLSTPSVHLSVHEELAGRARTFKSISFRREGVQDFGSYAAGAIAVNVDLSTAATTAATVNAAIATNHGSDRVRATSFGVIQLPATRYSGPASPFQYTIPLSQPYAFPGRGPMCVEIQVVSRTQTNSLNMDFAWSSSASPPPATRRIGTGCKATGRTQPVLVQPSGTANWPGNSVTMTYHGSNLPASAVVTVGLGVSDKILGGIPLPFELPGTGGAPSGACTVYNDFVLHVPSLTNASGAMTLSVGLGVNPFFNGLDVYGQTIALDRAANSYGVVLSNGVQHHLVGPYGSLKVGTVYANGSLGPNGTALRSQGHVMLFGE